MKNFIKNVQYNEKLCMVKKRVLSDSCHSSISSGFVHPIRDSIEFALCLLDNNEDTKKACNIIEKILSLQDLDIASSTYGLWSYFYEEDLKHMNPPDFNWADFISKILLMIDMDYKSILPKEISDKIKKAVSASCECIMKRNMGIYYTNITVMDCFVTIVAGEYYNEKKYFDYGYKKLESLYWFTQINGDISEYNSPVYTTVALGDLYYLINYVKNVTAFETAQKMYEKCWQCVAFHFHPTIKQWCGPQARNYTNFLTNEQKTMLQFATGVKLIDEPCLEYLSTRTKMKCPEHLLNMFFETRAEYSVTRVSKGFCYPCFSNSRMAVSMMTKEYSLGTFHHDEMWDQLRPLLGYFGDEENPYCLRIRSLHDDFDFSSSEIHCAQYKGNVIGIINYACDRGDKHICLDNLQDKKTMAEDIRVRFSINGDITKLKIEENGQELLIKYKDLAIRFAYDYFEFDKEKAEIQLTKTDDYLCFDAILYFGEKKEILFSDDEIKVCAFSLEMGEITKEKSQILIDKNKITTKNSCLKVTTRCKSSEFPTMNIGDEIFINDINIEEIS